MTALGQQTDSTFLADLLKKNPDMFQHILDKPHKNEVQILYTQIHRDRDNIPHFKSFSYATDRHYSLGKITRFKSRWPR